MVETVDEIIFNVAELFGKCLRQPQVFVDILITVGHNYRLKCTNGVSDHKSPQHTQNKARDTEINTK